MATAEPTAADKETARELIRRGNAAFTDTDFTAALRAYRDADAIMGVPTTGLGVARALDKLGRWVEARDAALQVTLLPRSSMESAPFVAARGEAQTLAKDLAARIPTLVLQIDNLADGATGSLEVDGERVRGALHSPRRLDPGRHRITLRVPGYADHTVLVSLDAGETETLSISLKPAPGSPSAGSPSAPTEGDARMPIWVASFSLGGAALVVGTATGIASLDLSSQVDKTCTENLCPSAQETTNQRATTLAHISTASFVMAGAGLTVGLAALFWPSDPPGDTAYVEPLLGPGMFGLRGRF